MGAHSQTSSMSENQVGFATLKLEDDGFYYHCSYLGTVPTSWVV
jgi:hypothetical protein